MRLTVVPNRNMIMLSIAVGHAIALGAGVVAYAAHGGDHEIYPDCRPEFVDTMRAVTSAGNWERIAIEAPFLELDKSEVCARGAELGVDHSKTWTCYEGAPVHCGKCGACVERKEAFVDAGIEDPTLYA